jgi:hypothetical protein
MTAKSSQQRVVNVAKFNAFAAAAVIATAIGASGARGAIQTYSAASGAGGVGVDHPGFGFFQFDPGGWDTGLDGAPTHPPAGEFAFSGSDGAFHMEVHTLLNQGVTGSTGDHAAYFQMNYNPNPPTTSFGTFWFGGVGNDIGPFPHIGGAPVPLNQVLMYADTIAPAGKPMEFRTESDFGPNGNGVKFGFTGTGTWQAVGGPLSLAVGFGNFNLNDPQLASLIAFGQGNEITAVDDGSDPLNVPEVRVDNLTLTIAQATWTSAAAGNWSDNSKWDSIAPDGGNATAVFGSAITAPTTVTIDGEHFAGTLRFDNASAYTLGGTGQLNLRAINTAVASGTFSAITVVSGSHTISAPLVLWSDTTITTPASSTMTVSGNFSAHPGVTITKAGAGTFAASTVRADGLTINTGTVKLLPNGTAAATGNVKTLTIAGGAAPSAKLDVTNNAFVVDYTGASPLATIKSQIAAGYNGGGWTGNGIVTSNGDSNHFAVGYGEASALASVPAIFGTPDNTSVLFRYTRYGDATLDGAVNLADFNKLAGSFGQTGKVWTDGDFNYDGSVNLTDFNLLAGNFGLSAAGSEVTPQDWSNLAAAVPEPSTLILSGVPALAGMCLRRRRTN